MAKPKTYTITEPVFKTAVHLLFGGSHDECIRTLVKEFRITPQYLAQLPRGSINGVAARTFFIEPEDTDLGYAFILIWLPDRVINSVVVHELVHACVFFLEDRGIPIKRETDEALTYLLMYYLDETEKLRKKHYAAKSNRRSK